MRLDAGSWYDASRNPERRGALLRQLESGRFVEFEALDDAGDRRGLILAEVIGLKVLAASQLEVIVVEPVAAEQALVLEWAKEHLTAPAALFVAPGPRLGDYKSICDGEDFVVMLVARIRQVTRAAAEASWAGAALALHSAEAERERPPRRGTVAPPGREVVPPWRAPGPLPRQAAPSADEEEEEYEAPSADEALDGDAATSRELHSALRRGDATMDAVEDLRRRVRVAPAADDGGSRISGDRRRVAPVPPAARLGGSRISGDGRPRIAGGQPRACLAPPPLLGAEPPPLPGGGAHAAGRDAGPLWPPAPLLPPGGSELWVPGQGPGPPAHALLDERGASELPADWGEKLARAFVERARAVHSGTATEEGLSVREILSLRSGRLYSSRTCTRLLKAAEHPADLLPPEGKCYGTVTRQQAQAQEEGEAPQVAQAAPPPRSSSSRSRTSSRSSVPAAAPARADSGFFAPPGTWAASPTELRGWPWSSPTVSSSSRWRS